MEPQNLEITVERLRSALGTNRSGDAISVLLDLHPADQAEVFNVLTEEERNFLLPIIDIDATANLFEELEDEEVAGSG